MDHAEFARRMAETTQSLMQAQRQLAQSALPGEDMQAFAAQTLRLVRRVQAFAGVLIGLSLLFAGSVVWQHVTQGTAHAALTQALLETLRRGQP